MDVHYARFGVTFAMHILLLVLVLVTRCLLQLYFSSRKVLLLAPEGADVSSRGRQPVDSAPMSPLAPEGADGMNPVYGTRPGQTFRSPVFISLVRKSQAPPRAEQSERKGKPDGEYRQGGG